MLYEVITPQKVKNMVTSMPIATAPLAIMKAAIALSKSPEIWNGPLQGDGNVTGSISPSVSPDSSSIGTLV